MENRKFSLKSYVYRYRWSYLMGIAVLTIVDLASLYIPQFGGEIVDGLTAGTLTPAGIRILLLKIFAAGAAMTLGRFGWRYFIIGASRKIEYNLRNDMFDHIEGLSARFFNAHKTGDLMAHFTNDLEAVRIGVGHAVITTFDALIMSVMVIVKMIVYVDLRLTVMAFIPLILVAVGCYYFGIEMKKRQTKRYEAFSELSDRAQESISGIRVLKAFVQEDEDLEGFRRSSENTMEKNLSVVKLRAIIGPLLDLIIGISILVTLIFGGKMVTAGTVTIGQFVAFNSYIGMLVWPMIACGDCINLFSQASAALKRIGAIFNEKPDITEAPEAKKAGEIRLKGDIELRHLTFTYPDGQQPALEDISLHVKPGETLAILGRTGSGKSTLSDLLLRVYDCRRGMLLMDNIPIDELPLRVLHRDIAYVPQENFLFSDTLEENIAFGLEQRIADSPEIRRAVREAARSACIHDNIMDFPEGYETLVGERGVTLSGGQKQRSSIARAVLKDSPILILDDALSAVDTDTEEKILENLSQLRRGKTTIMIAHRVSTLQKADHIAVLTDGKLSEYGTHEELVKLGGFYAHIYEKQQLEEEISSIV